MDYRERISIDPRVRSGKPCIRGTRIAVADVFDYLGGGPSSFSQSGLRSFTPHTLYTEFLEDGLVLFNVMVCSSSSSLTAVELEACDMHQINDFRSAVLIGYADRPPSGHNPQKIGMRNFKPPLI